MMDLSVCDFFLCVWEEETGGGVIKDYVHVLPLPPTLAELKKHITAAMKVMDAGMLENVWGEFNYHIDVCRASKGGHILSTFNLVRKMTL